MGMFERDEHELNWPPIWFSVRIIIDDEFIDD